MCLANQPEQLCSGVFVQIELGLKNLCTNTGKSNVLSLSHIELGRHSWTFLFQPDIAEPGKIILNILIKSNQVLIDRVLRPTWKVDNVY